MDQPYGIFCLQGTGAQALLKNQAKPSKSAFGEKGVMQYAVYAVGRYPGRSGGVCGIPAPQALYCLGKGEANKGNFNQHSGQRDMFIELLLAAAAAVLCICIDFAMKGRD